MNMKMLIVLALLAVPCVSHGDIDPKDSYKIATEALVTLGKLITEQNYEAMGFNSVTEVTSATLGQPSMTYMIRLDDLRAYQHGQDPEPLVKPVDRIIYPVMVGRQVRSGIFVDRKAGSWKATGFGSPKFVQALAQMRTQVAGDSGLPEQAFFSVQIPGLDAQFIGHRIAGKLMLTSLFDNPTLGLVAGRTLPAADLLATLVSPSKSKAYSWPNPPKY